MKIYEVALAVSLSALLAGCGGGGVTSTPAPSPSPTPTPTPTPTGTPISNLTVNQAFSEGATTTTFSASTPDAVVQSTAASRTSITITYDAANKSYTVATAGHSETFGPSDEQPQRWQGERRFATAGASSFLTLVTNPYSDAEYSNKYVGMGYWQANAGDGSMQQTDFSTFTYGFETAGSSVPRTGAAHWLTDVLGVLAIPGRELRILQGQGDFAVDFADNTFVSSASLDEYNVVTNGGATGSLRLQAGGQLNSSNGFSGLLSYEGGDTLLHGALAGSFYGPNAEEIGATFNASGNGASLTGALSGQQFPVGSSSSGIQNISLTNLLADDLLAGQSMLLQWSVTEGESGYSSVVHGRSSGTVELFSSGDIRAIGITDGYLPKPEDIDPQGPENFTTYRSMFDGNPLTVSVYTVGSANSDLPLTYTSLISWQSSTDGAIPTGQTTETFRRRFLVYGIPTKRELLTERTGTATYAGVVFGAGANMLGDNYVVGGTSQFAVDFSGGAYNGFLQLSGTDRAGATTDFGQWTFASTLGYGQLASAPLVGPGTFDPASSIFPQFYGPTGQEIGAIFSLGIGWPQTESSIVVVGATMAKAQ